MSAVPATPLVTHVPFVAHWRKVLMESGVDRTAMLVGFILAEHADYDTGANARPSQSTISDYLGGLSRESIRQATHQLREAGLIRVSRKPSPGRPTVWHLVDPWATEQPTPQLTPQATPQAHLALPVTSVGVEEDAPDPREPEDQRDRGEELRDVLADAMGLVDPQEAERARGSRRVLAQSRMAARAGRTTVDVMAAWHERVPEEGFDNGPGFALALLSRVTAGTALPVRRSPGGSSSRRRQETRGTTARSRDEFGESSSVLTGW